MSAVNESKTISIRLLLKFLLVSASLFSFQFVSAQCNPPSAISINSINDVSLNFSWTKVAGSTGYEYVVSDSDVFPVSTGTFTTDTFANLTSLAYNTRYIFVRAICGAAVSPSWTRYCKTTPASLSGGGSWCQNNFVGVGISEGLISNQVYTWYRAGSPTPIQTRPGTDGSGGSQSYNISSFAAADAGTYSVTTAKSGCEASTFGNSIVLLAYPENLQITNVTQSSVSFKWNQVGTSTYEYAITTSPVTTPPSNGTSTSATNASISGLPTNTSLYLHVRASCNFGTSFGEWNTLAFSTAALPVKLEHFTGRKTGTVHQLTWKVTRSLYSSGSMNFEIQRSPDGRSYTTIHSYSVTSDRFAQPFEFTDAQPLSRDNFYRLRITENTNQAFYSPTLKIKADIITKALVSLFPNPLQNYSTLQLELDKPSLVAISISDINGKHFQHITKQAHYSEGVHQMTTNTSSLSAGIYFCKVWVNGIHTQTIKLVKYSSL